MGSFESLWLSIQSQATTDAMKVKDFVIIGLLLVLAVVSYFLGYRTGAHREALRGDARFRVALLAATYHSAESGNFQKVKSNLGMALLIEVRSYQHQFGEETGTNNFAKRFAEAKSIADRVESQLVPISSILTNVPHSPDVKITVTKEKD